MTTEDARAISLVAVIRRDPNRPVSDIDRFLALAVPSFERFLGDGLVEELVVITPERDVAEATRRIPPALGIPVRVVDEKDVIPHLDHDAAGWMKQQVIKLAAPAVVRTPWFITLDADVVAARPVDREFLLPGGRALWQQESAGAHMDWWRNSARVLRSGLVIDSDQPVFGVTPAIMHAPSLVALGERIEREHPGMHWTRTLMDLADEGWTEYTLYWTHVLDTGAADALYTASGDGDRPYSLNGSVWVGDHLSSRALRDQLADVFSPDAPHAFFVFQSNLDRPLAETVALVRPLLGGHGPTRAEKRLWARRARTHRARSVLLTWRARLRRLIRG
ncbi:DUF6492 family protein [Microbacterium ulmi]|uniref:Uncharacterized protein n=1 Tax=Microbacterium ulmi TaxID=179095 RepID=A0A7Y2M003_9MICO|nr:hypothetical protein [Microbacterium ulmi]NNH03264.1 hypothetical protein [Microbacterium ulmi]